MKKILETDWLGSTPVFYNEKTGAVSNSINDIIDYKNLEFEPEGLNNYLEYGYSVFGQTPLHNIKFLEPCSKITSEDGRITIDKLSDPLDNWKNRETTPEEVVSLTRNSLEEWQNSFHGDIILPLSGGFDSRFLANLSDQNRIRAFSYGISEKQTDSREVIYSKEAASRLGIKWDFVPLHKIHSYLPEWDGLFASSVHAHGMYHFAFYKKVREFLRTDERFHLLSGIFGDLWAGNLKVRQINSPEDLYLLSYNHGINADKKYSKISSPTALRDAFWEKHRYRINEPLYQTVLVIRSKMVLISYLLSIPKKFNFEPWSPFLDPEICLSMASLPQNLRNKRQWQRDYFKSVGLDVESSGIKYNDRNTLDLQAIQEEIPPLLNHELLSEIIDERYIDSINAILNRSGQTLPQKRRLQGILSMFRVYGLFRRLGMPELYGRHNKESDAYNAYITLRPLGLAIQKRTGK